MTMNRRDCVVATTIGTVLIVVIAYAFTMSPMFGGILLAGAVALPAADWAARRIDHAIRMLGWRWEQRRRTREATAQAAPEAAIPAVATPLLVD